MKRLLRAIALTSFFAMPAAAQDFPVVVELYTSQGCSSCPPADEIMAEIAGRDDVIALSLHVDYWDYIGWKDEFADPRNAKRQRGYAMEAGRRSIYTPEMIVNGVSDIVGAKPMKLATAIAQHKNDPQTIDLEMTRTGDVVLVEARQLTRASSDMVVHILRYQPEREANIKRGENAGRTIRYANVTQDWKVLGAWDGSKPLRIEADAPGKWPVVVLIQDNDYGPILAAGRLK